MDYSTTNLRAIKKMRLERHWSQEQLAEMSGLSVRTIQRIENGENAGLESLKSLASVFETNITDSNKKEEIEHIRKQEEYVQNVKGFYGFLALAIFSLGVFFIIALFDSDSEGWFLFFYMLIFYALALGVAYHKIFDFFGEDWKRKLIDKKFKKK
jgi:transcriptional regulator with XRE-family HTH domain